MPSAPRPSDRERRPHADNIVIHDDAIQTIIQRYTRERASATSSARSRHLPQGRAQGRRRSKTYKEEITREVTEHLACPLPASMARSRTRSHRDGPGVTEVGGELLTTEATLMAGKAS